MPHHRPKPAAPLASHPAARRLLAALALTGATAANAAGFGIGIAAGPDRGRVDCVASFACDRSSAFAKLFAAYRFDDAFDMQAVYFDGGSFRGGDTAPLGTEFGGRFKVNGLGLTAGYRWSFAPSWSLSARAGLASVRTRFEYAAPFDGIASVSRTTTQPLLGAGVAYAVTPQVRFGLDYDVTRFKVHTTRGPLQMLGLSAQYSF